MTLPLLIRDPIHGSIKIETEEEKKVLDSPFFQRLRYISQLSGAQMVYPSATHTRFAHSLGVMYLAGLYARALLKDDEERISAIRLAAMLHDIGHGPYSHQFDDAVYSQFYSDVPEVASGQIMGHDYQRFRILEKMAEENYIKDKTYEMILEIWQDKDLIGAAIVQGVLGADRLDFLIRDSYFCGTQQFGMVPIDRIIKNSYVVDIDGTERLAYSYKLLDDLYITLVGRFFMYRNVYFHKAARSADIMIQQLLRMAYKPLNLGDWINDLDLFSKLNEFTLGGLICSSEDKEIRDFYERIFVRRKLYKMVFESFAPESLEMREIRRDVLRLYLEKMYLSPLKARLNDIPIIPDTLLDITFFNPDEFRASNVFIYDPKKRLGLEEVITMEEALNKLKYLPIAKEFGILRLYTEPEFYDLVKETIAEIEKERKESLPSTKA
ncbi:MAG: HD domain-containing protein [Candidatus Odinarchaeota archaeon]|nr:HD domain-containing protein [Candidatus Odinarchaeota archaeon]